MLVLVVLGLVSAFAGRYVKNSFPVQNWSVNQRQALSVVWFLACVLILLGLNWLAIAMRSSDLVTLNNPYENFLVNYLFKSIGSGLFTAFIFNTCMVFKLNSSQ